MARLSYIAVINLYKICEKLPHNLGLLNCELPQNLAGFGESDVGNENV